MSADNWAVCPRCLKSAVNEREQLEQDIREKYGKIPAEKYIAMVEKAKTPFKEPPATLREDYELGTNDDGVFSVNYQCSCSKCGYEATFKHDEVLTLV